MINLGVMEYENRRRVAASYLAMQRKRKAKARLTMTLLISFVVLILSVTYAFAGYDSHYRQVEATVCHHGVRFVTDDGNIWEITEGKTLPNGSRVTLTFDTKGTTSIYDDEIVP